MCSACGSGPARAPWETEAHGATPRHHRRRAEQATELLGGRATVKPYGACGYLLVGPTGTTKVAQDLDGLIALVDTPASRRSAADRCVDSATTPVAWALLNRD